MLLDDDVITQRKAEAGSLAGGLRRKERIEHLVLHLGRNAGAVIAYPDLYAVAEVFGLCREGRFVAFVALCVPNIRFSMDAENRRGKFAT